MSPLSMRSEVGVRSSCSSGSAESCLYRSNLTMQEDAGCDGGSELHPLPIRNAAYDAVTWPSLIQRDASCKALLHDSLGLVSLSLCCLTQAP